MIPRRSRRSLAAPRVNLPSPNREELPRRPRARPVRSQARHGGPGGPGVRDRLIHLQIGRTCPDSLNPPATKSFPRPVMANADSRGASIGPLTVHFLVAVLVAGSETSNCGSPFSSAGAIPGRYSTSSSASSAGGFGSLRTRSCSRPTATRHSGSAPERPTRRFQELMASARDAPRRAMSQALPRPTPTTVWVHP
jgi:hypothetical protein